MMLKGPARKLVWIGTGVLVLILVGIAASYFLGQLYLWTENRNFAKIREKSKLNCAVMPFHCAVRDAEPSKLGEQIAKLKAEGLDINSRDRWQATALMYAAVNKPDLIEELLKFGADPNLSDENGQAPLTMALLLKRYDLARELINSGANPNILIGSSAKKMTVLTEMVTQKNAEAAEFLVLNGADPKLKDEYGYNACERASLYHTESMFSFCRGK